MKAKWYNKKWITITLGLVAFPLGLYGLWKTKSLKIIWKITLSILSPLSTILSLILIVSTVVAIFFRAEYHDWSAEKPYDNHDYEGAIKEYNLALEAQPSYAPAYLQRGNCYSLLGNEQKALVNYTLAIQFDSNYTKAYYNRGLSRALLKNRKEAIEDYNHVIKLDSTYSGAYTARGREKYSLGDLKGAILDYDKAIKLKPNDAESYYIRGLFKYDMSMPEAALTDFDQAIHLNGYSNAFYDRGRTKIQLYRFSDACNDFEAAIAAGDKRGIEAKERNCK